MTALASPALPRLDSVFLQQLRVTGRKLRPELMLSGLALLVPTAAFLADGRFIAPEPEVDGLIVLAAFFFAFAVWRGERLFRDAPLWTLPVERTRHALIRVGAGWVWLMAAGLFAVLWLAALAALTGGLLAGEETGVLIPATAPQPPLPRGLSPDAPIIAPYQWLAPFGGATVLYLAGSAFALGFRHPLRWAVGVAVALVALVALLSYGPLTDLAESAAGGSLGLEVVLTGADDGPSAGGLVDSWVRGVVGGWSPIGRWALATAAWLTATSAALGLALWRHRER